MTVHRWMLSAQALGVPVLSHPLHPQPLQNVSSSSPHRPSHISRRLRPRPPLCFSLPYEPLRVCLPATAATVIHPPPFRRIAGMSRDHAPGRKDRDGCSIGGQHYNSSATYEHCVPKPRQEQPSASFCCYSEKESPGVKVGLRLTTP